MKKRIYGFLIATATIIFLGSMPVVAATQQEDLTEAIQRKFMAGTKFLLGIESRLKEHKEEFALLRTNTRAIENKIEETKINIAELSSQLENLRNLINVNRGKIEATSLQIAERENRIEILQDEIEESEEELRRQEKIFMDALTSYYVQTNSFFGDGPNLLAFLAEDKTTGETVKENIYLKTMQGATEELGERISQHRSNLESRQKELQKEKDVLNLLQILLEKEKRGLAEAENANTRLLAETQGKQAIYEALLEVSKKEAVQVSQEIARLKENFSFFESKLKELKNSSGTSSIEFPDISELDSLQLAGGSLLSWPISPALGLSAFFQDSAYEKAIGIEHNAIDIRALQGSAVKSASNGVVSKVADNGFAYSYVIIAHPGNFLTLYGHLSDIFVSEGEIVRAGQSIGLSGGMPGTKGAGWLTTGPHLHFEVFKDWKQVDPLDYLPLELVPLKSLPEKYLEKVMLKLQ